MTMTHFRARWTVALLVGAYVVVLDQIAKAAVANVRSAAIIQARNPGFITGWSPVSAGAVIALTGVVLLGFIAVIGRWAVQIGIPPLIPTLVGAGMAAHAIDRIRFGSVRDFLSTGWLIIDVGDIAVVVGLVALGIAFALRMRQLRLASQSIILEPPTLRAVVVDSELAPAA
jgi:lipoprotein signal peptidase